MKLSQDENEKNNFLQKIKYKYNIRKNMSQPSRLYSSYKQRPITTKSKRSFKLNKLSSFDKTTYDIPYFGYNFNTSKYFPNKIYLNQNNFIWGKHKLKRPNKYYEKEELFDRVIKLQSTVNNLNNKNNKQKIEINKQKEELKKQNKILNEVNTKFFFDKILKNENKENKENYLSDTPDNLNDNNNNLKRSYSTAELNGKNVNNISNKLLDNMNTNNLKDLYKKALKQNEIKEQEILRLKEKIDSIKFSNETMLSNMKLQYKQLQNENNKKIQEFSELKKSSKCTKYNEIMKEKEIYEKEMINIKNKFYNALRQLEKYKHCYEENKILIEEINKKNAKINKLENEIILFSKNSENLIEKMKKEINKKNKKIQKLENDMKKYICLYNSIQKDDDKKINIFNKGYRFIFQNKNNIELYDINKNNNNKEISNDNNDINNNENNYINNNNKENELVNQNENKDNNNDNIDNNDNNDNENNNRNIYVNHCLNFSNKNNNNNKISQSPQSLSSNSSRANLFSASWKNINMRKEKINSMENNNVLKNSRIIEIINSYPELFQLYIEMKKRNINDSKTYINEILLKLKEDNSNIDNKNIYCNSIIKLFNIEDENSKKIITDLSNKEFDEKKNLQEIKINHIKLFNELFNQKRENKNNDNNDIINKKLKEINNDELNNIINKYDNCESGYVFFNQMISIIKELKLEEYIEDILLLTKEADIFDLMDYNKIINIINKKETNKKELIENEENKEGDNKDNSSKNNLEPEIKDKEQDKENDKDNDKENDKDNDKENDKDNDNNNENEENINKIFKKFAHIILIEGSTPSAYISSLKELVKIGEDNDNSIEVINSENFFNFLNNKNVALSEEEQSQIIKKYRTKLENKFVLDYEKIVGKIFEYMKNDEENSYDEDFMKNIKNMDIEGMD